ncbi:PREDICTED: uncharacterized protein LOC104711261 [Camelina sativa]|uniref:Uncharacterized protein LOC104711261 n=1 Tax=Camelina sativa TaxID=90675 RepID=A0ABM0TGW5_CAMSA|nr:PREDICTED: uncharacterized protein LOC104711261 [Camelina sativa]
MIERGTLHQIPFQSCLGVFFFCLLHFHIIVKNWRIVKMKTTKEGNAMNPTDAIRKEQRKKDLRRNKIERNKVREVGILKKGPEQIKEQIRKLDMPTCLNILQENKAEKDTPVRYQLTRAEKDAIFRSVVPIQKGRRFGVGSIPFDEEVGQSSYKKSCEAKWRETEDNYLQTQTMLSEIKANIKKLELEHKCEDVVFWCSMMAQLYPNLVPPSQRNKSASTEPVTDLKL